MPELQAITLKTLYPQLSHRELGFMLKSIKNKLQSYKNKITDVEVYNQPFVTERQGYRTVELKCINTTVWVRFRIESAI